MRVGSTGMMPPSSLRTGSSVRGRSCGAGADRCGRDGLSPGCWFHMLRPPARRPGRQWPPRAGTSDAKTRPHVQRPASATCPLATATDGQRGGGGAWPFDSCPHALSPSRSDEHRSWQPTLHGNLPSTAGWEPGYRVPVDFLPWAARRACFGCLRSGCWLQDRPTTRFRPSQVSYGEHQAPPGALCSRLRGCVHSRRAEHHADGRRVGLHPSDRGPCPLPGGQIAACRCAGRPLRRPGRLV